MNQLTGRTRFRSNWRGKLLLQVQYFEVPGAFLWRDATTEDLAELQYLTFSRIEINVRLPDIPRDFDPSHIIPLSPTKH